MDECKELIHQRVKTINPPKGEPKYGRIKWVESFFVKILSSDGSTRIRAAKNMRIIHDGKGAPSSNMNAEDKEKKELR